MTGAPVGEGMKDADHARDVVEVTRVSRDSLQVTFACHNGVRGTAVAETQLLRRNRVRCAPRTSRLKKGDL
jgi:hypothetical protein